MARLLSRSFPAETASELQPARWPSPLRAAALLAFLALLFAAILWQPLYALGGLLAFGVLVIGLFAAWYFPEFGLLALLFVGSQILDPNLISIPSPVGSINFADLALMGLGGMSLVRVIKRDGYVLPRSAVMPPFIILMWLAGLSTLLAIRQWGVTPSLALNELRGLVYYGTLLLVMWDIRERAQLVRLLWGLYLIGLFVVAIMIVQQFHGPVPLLASAQSSNWMIISSSTGGITRVRPPAHVLLYFLSILSGILAAYLPKRSSKLIMLGLAVLLNLALLLTFTRTQWVASGLAMALAILLFPRRAQAVAGAMVLVVIVLGAGFYVTQRSHIEAFVGRVTFATPLIKRVQSMFELDQTLNSYSAQTRYFEADAAMIAIKENPVLGVGLGNNYRGMTAAEAETRYTRFLRFIENSYIYMATKMGLPSLLILAWLGAAALWGAWRGFRGTTDPLLRGVALGCLTSVAGIIAWAYNHPLLMLPEYTIMIGLILGLGEAVGLISRGEAK